MIHNGEGIYNTIKNNQTFELAPLDTNAFNYWVGEIMDSRNNKSKRKVIMHTECLISFYNEFGLDKFRLLLEKTDMVVSQSGIDFIKSLGIK